MKPLIKWSQGRIFALTYLPCLALSLLGFSQLHNSISRSILQLLGSVWYMGCYALYLGAIAVTISNRLPSDHHGAPLQKRLRFPVVYILLPILALFRPFKPNLLPSLSTEHPLILLTVSMLCFLGPAYLTATYLTSLEQGRPTRFRENVSTCLALSFFPLSVFSIQPRVKQALHAKSTENDSFD